MQVTHPSKLHKVTPSLLQNFKEKLLSNLCSTHPLQVSGLHQLVRFLSGVPVQLVDLNY